MSYKFNNEIPIYLQIADIITNEITSGQLKPGQKLMSVREYASYFSANPNTIAKSLQILEDRNLIYTERTNGKFVTKEADLISKNKEVIFNEKVKEFIDTMTSIGYTKDEIIKKIKEM